MPQAIIPAVIGGAATIASSAISAKTAADTNKSQIKQAQTQMDFQERMRNTAHQAEVEDLRAAGLNPILSANGGAAVPSGAQAVLQNPAKDVPSDVSSAVGQYQTNRMNDANIKLLSASRQAQMADAAQKNTAAERNMEEVKSVKLDNFKSMLDLQENQRVRDYQKSWMHRYIGLPSQDILGGLSAGHSAVALHGALNN